MPPLRLGALTPDPSATADGRPPIIRARTTGSTAGPPGLDPSVMAPLQRLAPSKFPAPRNGARPLQLPTADSGAANACTAQHLTQNPLYANSVNASPSNNDTGRSVQTSASTNITAAAAFAAAAAAAAARANSANGQRALSGPLAAVQSAVRAAASLDPASFAAAERSSHGGLATAAPGYAAMHSAAQAAIPPPAAEAAREAPPRQTGCCMTKTHSSKPTGRRGDAQPNGVDHSAPMGDDLTAPGCRTGDKVQPAPLDRPPTPPGGSAAGGDDDGREMRQQAPFATLAAVSSVAVLLLLLYVCFATPYVLCFGIDYAPSDPLGGVEIAITVIFCLDALLAAWLRWRGARHRGEGSAAASRRAGGWLLAVDVAAALPFAFIVGSGGYSMLHAIKVSRRFATR